MKIKYITMIVEDMDESVRFYRDVMGFEVDSHYDLGDHGEITLLRGDGETMVELIRNPINKQGLFSVGMDVDDLEVTLRELRSRGAKVVMEPTPITVGKLAFIEDPNGVRIALIQHMDSE
ncbi:glyoxalase/bleomycin resistance/dioxygenase family protein [Methanothermobacter sp. THM-2]|uniref:Predicted glyoxalase family protein n=2 Tax=Methanothermobacter TaxID=145260 RepID=D9PWZ7_METTM|nr:MULTISPECIES: VOC family protein [Methanothermobacter]ADL58745.1 predicted glyoxalase family protein [Methanothermobacter marburgensis str. Marburg]QHN07445.1 glyoxalase/bleomycin resistance/dioxygenase family protein [Methanothermobacter sp. THM-2]WBF09311.1 VOC family protein [Methanothermobacter marburgensis]